ncbi:MAG: hydroxymyristoyl-ACP dehydratase [Bacteroidetes bacterium]|nr:hydroxymyristoyl-ACP dehydratase [Bacteroidota bacterium]
MIIQIRQPLSTGEIVHLLPQQPPFRFVDEIIQVNGNNIRGKYCFKEDEFFYKGHFPKNPVTPGVILTECMAQIGLVCMGISLIGDKEIMNYVTLVFTQSEVEFLRIVYPGETVIVEAEKIFFRRNKLKCKVKMITQQGEEIASGILSGMFIPRDSSNNQTTNLNNHENK